MTPTRCPPSKRVSPAISSMTRLPMTCGRRAHRRRTNHTRPARADRLMNRIRMPSAALTLREIEVSALVADGLSNQSAAADFLSGVHEGPLPCARRKEGGLHVPHGRHVRLRRSRRSTRGYAKRSNRTPRPVPKSLSTCHARAGSLWRSDHSRLRRPGTFAFLLDRSLEEAFTAQARGQCPRTPLTSFGVPGTVPVAVFAPEPRSTEWISFLPGSVT